MPQTPTRRFRRLSRVAPFNRPLFASLICALACALTGCSPSINVLGAFFPSWLFCMAGALAATLIVRGLLIKKGLASNLGLLVIIYTSCMVIFSLLLWLIFFKN